MRTPIRLPCPDPLSQLLLRHPERVRCATNTARDEAAVSDSPVGYRHMPRVNNKRVTSWYGPLPVLSLFAIESPPVTAPPGVRHKHRSVPTPVRPGARNGHPLDGR